MKLTKKQIDLIRANTPEALKGTFQSIATPLGDYYLSNANWGYHAGWTKDGVLLVTRFREVM